VESLIIVEATTTVSTAYDLGSG